MTLHKCIAILILFFNLQPVFACSCRGDLQSNYDRAHRVLVVDILSCSENTSTGDSGRVRQVCSIHVSEVIKGGAVDFVNNDTMPTCGYPLMVDKKYMLFLDENNQSNFCSGTAPVDPQAQKVSLRELYEAQQRGDGDLARRSRDYWRASQLKKLRDYRDGKRVDLIDYWRFDDTGWGCQLTQSGRNGGVPTFLVSALYTELPKPDLDSTSMLGLRQTIPPNQALKMPAIGTLQITIEMPHQLPIQDKPGELIIGGASYEFEPRQMATENRSLVVSTYEIFGQSAEKILAALTRESVATFRAHLERAAPTKRMQLRTTRKTSTVEQFATVIAPPADNRDRLESDDQADSESGFVRESHEYIIDIHRIDDGLSGFIECREKSIP